MITCELGQARKGATAASDSCAGVSALGEPPTPILFNFLSQKIIEIHRVVHLVVHFMGNALDKSPSYLFKSRHGIWYARVVVPEARQDALGKRELRKSLATRNRLEAIQRSGRDPTLS